MVLKENMSAQLQWLGFTDTGDPLWISFLQLIFGAGDPAQLNS